MILSEFLKNLYEEGRVVVAERDVVAFGDEDLRDSLHNLHLRYSEDVAEMPALAPPFDAEAALWAAQYFCRAVQLTVHRHLDESMVAQLLTPFPGLLSSGATYSADLVLRYLPDLFRLAKGLSPRDVVVRNLTETAAQWPFSSIGIGCEPLSASLQVVLSNPSLRLAYADRVLKIKDQSRAVHPLVAPLIAEALGAYAEALWPGFLTNIVEKTANTDHS